jgi:hypothetical protein
MVIYKMSRYRVTGFLDGVFVTTVFKTKKPAINYALKLSQGEVYDIEISETVYGPTTDESKTLKNRRNAHLE